MIRIAMHVCATFHETRVKARANRLLRISDTTIVILDLTILTRVSQAMQVRRNRIAQQHAIKVDDFQLKLVFGQAISPFS